MSKFLIEGEKLDNYLENGTISVVDFSSPYCAPCRKVPPVMEELEKEFKNRVNFLEINVAVDNDIALEYNVFSVPTVIVFKGKEEKERISGVPNRKKLETLLHKLFS